MTTPTRYSADEVARILERAAVIEYEQESQVSEQTLREIAGELGVNADALEQALIEMRTARVNESFPPKPSLPIAAGVLGAAVGAVTAFVRPFTNLEGVHIESLLGIALLAVILTRWAIQAKQADAPHRFFARSKAVWFWYAAAHLLVHGRLWDDMVFVAATAALSSALLGGLIMRVRQSGSPRLPPPSRTEGTDVIASSMTSRLSQWFGRLFRQTSLSLGATRQPRFAMAALLFIAACGTGGATLPDPDPVPSEWGGQRISARLAPDSVRIAFACSNIRAAGPIRVDNAGEFVISGLLRRSAVEDAPVTLRGRLTGDTLSLKQLNRTGSNPEVLDYRAVRGQAADFAGFFCTQ